MRVGRRRRLAALAAACAVTVAASANAQPLPLPDGAALFAAAGCAGCHGPAGEGRLRAPPLVGSAIAAAPGNLVFQILDGSGAMPSFATRLDDAAIAAIVNFVRVTLNDATDMIDAAFVTRIRN